MGYFGSMAATKITSVKQVAFNFIIAVVQIGQAGTRRLMIAIWMSLPIGFRQSRLIQASSNMTRGVSLVVEIIFLAVGLYVAAFILPGALTAIATTALTSVNSGVVTLFQVLVPLISVVVIILLMIAVVRRALE